MFWLVDYNRISSNFFCILLRGQTEKNNHLKDKEGFRNVRVWNILYKIIREWNLHWSIALSSAKQADKNLKYLPDKSQTYKSLMSCRYCQCEESSRKLLWCAVWCKCFCLINFFKALHCNVDSGVLQPKADKDSK